MPVTISDFYRTQVSLGSDLYSYGSGSLSLSEEPFADLTDEDTNSILTDNANRAIKSNEAMHVTQPGWKICNYCKWCHLVAKFETYTSGAIWWPILKLMKVAPSGGQIYN